MSSARTIRDPILDHLITPQNSAMTIIDFQPPQVSSVTSRDKETLVRNVVSMAKVGKLFGLPVVLSTVNVNAGINEPMIIPLSICIICAIGFLGCIEFFLSGRRDFFAQGFSRRPCGFEGISVQ